MWGWKGKLAVVAIKRWPAPRIRGIIPGISNMSCTIQSYSTSPVDFCILRKAQFHVSANPKSCYCEQIVRNYLFENLATYNSPPAKTMPENAPPSTSVFAWSPGIFLHSGFCGVSCCTQNHIIYTYTHISAQTARIFPIQVVICR